jgi:glutamate racemase
LDYEGRTYFEPYNKVIHKRDVILIIGVIILRIGFFDSGYGGITVLYEALQLLPEEDFVYFADTKNAPYGVKPKDIVKEYILDAVEFIINKEVEAIVVACNTATSIAIEDLRSKYNIPIIGMEPAVKPAVRNSQIKNKRVLVTATQLTIKEEKLRNLIDKLDNDDRVDLLALPGLVEYAEALQFNDDVVIPYLKEQLSGYDLEQYGTIVLGCTHFPYYKDMFKKIAPDDVDIIDGSLGTVKNLKRLIDIQNENKQPIHGSGNIEYYISGTEVTDTNKLEAFRRLLKRMEDISK